MKPKATILEVSKATYLDGYRLLIAFNDGKENVVDFEDFLTGSRNTFLSKYQKPLNFRRFKIEQGNLVWGKDWGLVFPIQQLYRGKVN